MARMLQDSATKWMGCCNACTHSRASRHRPSASRRHAGRAKEKRQVLREIREA